MKMVLVTHLLYFHFHFYIILLNFQQNVYFFYNYFRNNSIFYYTIYRGTIKYSPPICTVFILFFAISDYFYYRFRLINSSRSVSDVVITLEFAWKPLCVVIISVNSEARSTLDISSSPEFMVLPFEVISTPIPSNSPEFKVVR